MFWSKNKKNRYTPINPNFFYIKVGFEGVHIAWTCFPDVNAVFYNIRVNFKMSFLFPQFSCYQILIFLNLVYFFASFLMERLIVIFQNVLCNTTTCALDDLTGCTRTSFNRVLTELTCSLIVLTFLSLKRVYHPFH